MMSSAPPLLQRVGGLIREHQHWFEAAQAWYKTAKWSKKIFTNYLMARNRPAGRALLSLNDRTLEDPFRDRQAPVAGPIWWIPASALRAGENQIRVWLDPKDTALSVDGINVKHEPDLTIETKRGHRPQPKPTAQTAIAVVVGAGYRPQADRWSVRVEHDHVVIALHFERDVPANCLVGIAVKLPTIGYTQILEDLWDIVGDAVKKKIKQLVKEYYRKLQAGDRSTAEIEPQLARSAQVS